MEPLEIIFADDPEVSRMLYEQKSRKMLKAIADESFLKAKNEIDIESLKGKDGKDGKDGESIIGPMGPKPVAGVDYPIPENGKDGEDGDSIVGPPGPQGDTVVGPPGADAIFDMETLYDEFLKRLRKKALDISHIRNADSFMYQGTRYKTAEMMHGGGGGGSSGTTLTQETPIGVVDDSNVTFTVVNTPLYIVVNGAQYTAGTGTFSSYGVGVITLSSPVGTGGFITSYFNA